MEVHDIQTIKNNAKCEYCGCTVHECVDRGARFRRINPCDLPAKWECNPGCIYVAPEEDKGKSGCIEWSIKHIPNQIGGVSLLGVADEEVFPISFGNYFSFTSGHYCLNMWAENLKEYTRMRNNANEDLGEIEIVEINDMRKFCLVVDKRIPSQWLNQEMCYTGCGYLSDGLESLITILNQRSKL